MYHAIVRRKITKVFAGLSAGRIKAGWPWRTQVEAITLRRIAAKGTTEAMASPITS